MKYFLITFVFVTLIFSGCADKRIILVPSNTYYPTFNTSDFNVSKKYKMNMFEINDNNSTSICADDYDMTNFIRNTKELRSNYNILLDKINKFNKKITKMNNEQKEKKPTEVNKIPPSWFK